MKNPTLFVCFISSFLVLLPSCSHPKADESHAFSDHSQAALIMTNEIVPTMRAMIDQGKFDILGDARINKGETATVLALTDLCRIGEHLQRQRMVIVTAKAQNSTISTLVFVKSHELGSWELRSVWTTTFNGDRRLFDLNRLPTRQDSARLTALEKEVKGDFPLFVLKKPSSTVRDEVIAKFTRLANENQLPYYDPRRSEELGAVATLTNDKASRRVQFMDVCVPLKDKSGELFYLFKREAKTHDWVLSNVLKLKADGAAIMLPITE